MKQVSRKSKFRSRKQKTRKQRGGECEQPEIERCKAMISKCSLPVAAGTVKNDPRYAPWFKKMSMGIPAGALAAKMKAEGLNPALLNTPNAPAPEATKAPTGMAGLLSGILGGPKLKKTAAPNIKPVTAAPEKKANPLMNEMAERLKKRAAKPTVFVDPTLQKTMVQEKSSALKNELLRKAKVRAEKTSVENVPNTRLPNGWKKKKNAVNTWYVNPQGESMWNLPPLPEGWTEQHDDTDIWYVSPTGESQWTHPGLD
jgi:hypothetical protein